MSQPRLLSLKSASPPRQKGWGRHFILSVKMRLKIEEQNDCHPPGHLYIYPAMPTSTCFSLISCTQSIVSVLVHSTSALKLMLWHLDTKENIDWKNLNNNMILLNEEESLMEDKRNNDVQRPHTRWNPKRHISLMSLLFCHTIATVRCFV